MKLTRELSDAMAKTLTGELRREGIDVTKVTIKCERDGLYFVLEVHPGIRLKVLCVGGTVVWKDLIAKFVADAKAWDDLHPAAAIVFKPHVLES